MYYQTSGANLFYEKCGEGQPLILLHGNGETHAIFDKAIPILKKQFTVYAIDSRGHGESSAIDEFHYADMAQDVYEFICGLNLDKPIVYGFSDGGIIALLMAIEHQEHLSGIIASGVNTQPEGIKSKWLMFFKLYYKLSKSPMFKLMISEPNITTEMLGRIQIPVSVVGGTKDLIKTEHMRQVSENIEGAHFTLLNGETHSSYVVNNERLAQIIMDEVEWQTTK